MSGHSFRFVHAADFHLEDAIRGLDEVPEHLRNTLVNAPHASVKRIFETAISERVDFVLLNGDLIDLDESGPLCVLCGFPSFHHRIRSGRAHENRATNQSSVISRYPLNSRSSRPSRVPIGPAARANNG